MQFINKSSRLKHRTLIYSLIVPYVPPVTNKVLGKLMLEKDVQPVLRTLAVNARATQNRLRVGLFDHSRKRICAVHPGALCRVKTEYTL
jgi:hypothetical protein